MKIQLTESGYTEEFKPLKELNINFGIAPESELGENIYFLGIENNSQIVKLFQNEDENIRVYLKNIIYLIFKDEPKYHTIRIYKDELKQAIEQIIENKRSYFLLIIKINSLKMLNV